MAFYNQYIADNPKAEFIHVSQDDSKKDAANWANSENFPWLTVLKSRTRTTGLHKFDSGTPSYALLDKYGKVLATSERECKKKIKELTQ